MPMTALRLISMRRDRINRLKDELKSVKENAYRRETNRLRIRLINAELVELEDEIDELCRVKGEQA